VNLGMPRPLDDRDGLRRCRDCAEWKPLDEFCSGVKRPSGKGSYCKSCFNVRSKVPDGHRYCPDCETIRPLDEFPRNRSGRRGYGRYCKPCHNVRSKAGKARLFGSEREYLLRYRYGIGEKEFHELLAGQGGVCAICGAGNPEHVDHDHLTGWVRGVLCFNCNGGLGQFRDRVEYLASAITYLKGSTWQRVLVHPGVYQLSSPRRGRLPSRST
jgi:hypothetical protein